jgi:hypothetical protein
MMHPHTVRDRIAFRASLEHLKVPAFLVIDALQHSTPDVQLEALSLTLATLCRSVGVDPHELVTRSNRQLAQADAVKNPLIEAISAYAAGELKR